MNSPAVFKWKNISVIAFLVLRCLQVSVGGSSKSGSVRSKGSTSTPNRKVRSNIIMFKV